MSLADIAQSAITIDVNGKKIELSPLGIGDLAAFQEYIKYQEYHELLRLPHVPPDILAETLRNCIKKSVDIASDTFKEHLTSMQGMVELLWVSAKHKNPDIDRSVFEGLDMEQVKPFFNLLEAMSGFADEQTQNPTQRHKGAHNKKTQRPPLLR